MTGPLGQRTRFDHKAGARTSLPVKSLRLNNGTTQSGTPRGTEDSRNLALGRSLQNPTGGAVAEGSPCENAF